MRKQNLILNSYLVFQGTKSLSKGNHDYWWQSISRLRKDSPDNICFTPSLQKSMMLQIQGVRGCSCSVLPQTLGNEGYAVYSAFPQGKKHANFNIILEFTRGRFQIFKLNSFKAVRLLSFMPPWHDFYATMGAPGQAWCDLLTERSQP